jgi:hypothetical protein
MADIEDRDHRFFPECDKTDSSTAPASTYMTLSAGSP